ncbi:hypothetical protein GDO81_026147 [Engystomops pustulosus]|uniref:Secreted protein n=1 Tax=Engystomops pustulosus TaxID=76066 RepID=A0AAV6YKC4_ENGPU|nr:hypothetical protein GDO81_026147 [Engystomops pustulosus]
MLGLVLVVAVYAAGVLVVQLQALLAGRRLTVLRHHDTDTQRGLSSSGARCIPHSDTWRPGEAAQRTPCLLLLRASL